MLTLDIGGDEIFEELYDDTLAFDFFYSESAMEHIAPDYLDKNISEFLHCITKTVRNLLGT